MNEEVRLSRLRVTRRRALSIGGTIGFSGLLAACTGDDAPDARSTQTPQSTATSGAAATTSTAAPASAASTASTVRAATDELTGLLDRANTCAAIRESTQGPYWFDVDAIRSDIREGRPGTQLQLALRVQDLSKCDAAGVPAPVRDSVVEIWHCDAGGIYSGFEDASTGRGGPGGSGGTSDGSYSAGEPENEPTDDGRFLRGAQVADANGIAEFTTIYPGWYGGRTVHIHLKVHVAKDAVLTSQIYFDDAISNAVFEAAPYRDHDGRDVTNERDGIFDESGMLALQPRQTGYLGVINVGIRS